jgi:hypothetical protein
MTCNLSGELRVVIQIEQKGEAVVGSGNIDVGNKTPTRNSDQPITEPSAKPDRFSERPIAALFKAGRRPGICGALSQQSGDNGRGTESAPQKFLQLVGYRDPKARAEPWVRPTPAKP